MIAETVNSIITSSWEILKDSSIFILFGFTIAGLLRGFLPGNFVSRHLGKGKYLSVIKASALGVPLPLCSCGVLPAAAGLKEDGANKGATAAFLISTPETGVDSIAVSWALLDPIMTVFRPVAAFFTAIVTGFTINILGLKDEKGQSISSDADAESSCCSSCCSHSHDAKNENSKTGFINKLKGGMSFAFGELFQDISKWFILGVLLAGIIDIFLSPNMISNYLGGGLLSMVLVLAVSAPLYICATASTPIAAALALKGLSPGAALVLLLAGPATNAAAIAVITKLLGKKATALYVLIIAVISIALGLLANHIYELSGLDTSNWIAAGGHGEQSIVHTAAAVILLVMIGRVLFMEIKKSLKI